MKKKKRWEYEFGIVVLCIRLKTGGRVHFGLVRGQFSKVQFGFVLFMGERFSRLK